MKMIDDVIIIGIDSGYGNIKTANCCFPASVSAYDKEPVFKENLLVYESKFYLIGEGHKEFLADKTRDLDYYVLALAAIARELNIRKMTCGKVRIAAGLPLTWVSGQRDEFRDYLLQNKAVDFSFRNVSYHVEIVGVDVFPQGFAAVADRLSDFRGVNMICDIGNGTMNIMFINDKKLNVKKNTNKPEIPGKVKKGYRIYVMAILALTLTMSMGVTAFAAGDPITVVNNLSDFIFGLIRAVGLILLGWGIVQVGLSFQSHDPSQRSNGFLTLAGGVIITFAKEILNLIVG